MKRAELHVGDEVVGRYGARMIVVDTAPWYEVKEYMGRFGSAGAGKYRPSAVGEPHNGVAVASQARATRYEPDVWRPDVVQLSSLRSVDAHVAQRARERQARTDRANREAALAARRDALPIPGTLEFQGGTATGRVTVSLADLEHLVDVAGRVGAP